MKKRHTKRFFSFSADTSVKCFRMPYSRGMRFIESEDPHMGMLIFCSGAPVRIPGVEDEDMYRVGQL